MGLFRPYERGDRVAEQSRLGASTKAAHERDKESVTVAATTAATETPVAPAGTATVVAGDGSPTPVRKKVPTPSRREAEQARRERLHPTLSKKESKARERQMRMAKRDEAIRAVDEQPGRGLARDYIDSKRRLTGYTMPLILGAMVLSIVGGMVSADLMVWTSALVWVILAGLVADLLLMWRGFRKLHAERLPNEPMKGLGGYIFNRAINPRRLRMPPPRVKIGDKI